jgi:fatty acid desaturase
MSPLEKAWELVLPLPWLVASLYWYGRGAWLPGAAASFYFFLTGLRQSHGGQHYTLGVGRGLQDAVLFALSLLMLCSMHAVQVSHLHHHRHCLDDDDAEGSTARLPWWQALLAGPVFWIGLHRTAWRLGSFRKRIWIAAEIGGMALVATAAIFIPVLALRAHAAAMTVGECMTGFFAVWTVHHDTDRGDLLVRTQRGRWINRLTYSMFFHAEHHLFPLVPTCHLAQLAGRLDSAVPHARWKQVMTFTRDRALMPEQEPGS